MPEYVDWYGSPDAVHWSAAAALPLPGPLLERIEALLSLQARMVAEGYASLGPDMVRVITDWVALAQEAGLLNSAGDDISSRVSSDPAPSATPAE
ncbi:UNVERIFIED_ORG: hypothetical protein FHR35_009148 [Microbispora rosea subsp. rosea]